MYVPSVAERQQESIHEQLEGLSAAMGPTIAATLPQIEDTVDMDAEEEGGGVIHPWDQEQKG